jgi:hypothetical protein
MPTTTNRIDTVLDALATQLALVAGVRELVRGPVFADTQMLIPAIGLFADRIQRDGKIWHVHVTIAWLGRSARGGAMGNVIAAIAAMDAAVSTVRDSGTAGGYIDTPSFDLWASPLTRGGPITSVGEWGSLAVTVEDPLLVTVP